MPQNASEAHRNGLAADVARAGGDTAARAQKRPGRWATRRGAARGEVRIYQHSNLVYWWVVWVYGYFCAALTAVWGRGVKELVTASGGGVKFHESPWVGFSFIALVLFVIIFTNVRARGVYSFVLLLLAVGIGWGIAYVPGIDTAMGWASLVRIHMNLAFYMTFSTLLMAIWLFVTVVVDHFTWWRFSPGQVIEEHRVGQATGHAYNTEGMVIRRLPDDFFRHRLLGLGSGDFLVAPPNAETFEIHNVWKANRKQRLLEDMIALRMTQSAQPRS
jgi:hypothetical protein